MDSRPNFALLGLQVGRELSDLDMNWNHFDQWDDAVVGHLMQYRALLEVCASRGYWDAIEDAKCLAIDSHDTWRLHRHAEAAAAQRKRDMSLSVDCPFCGALAGNPCVIGSGHKYAGRELSDFHAARFRNAEHVHYEKTPS